MGLHHPTPVQQHCIPATLEGRDVIARYRVRLVVCVVTRHALQCPDWKWEDCSLRTPNPPNSLQRPLWDICFGADPHSVAPEPLQ